MWSKNWREEIWQSLEQPWDIVVVGGGITGAGILREATRLGLKVLLVEQRDFAFGTSSRSSKLVHGGLRYLKQGKIGLTQASVQERQRLQESAPGLVDPLGFLLANEKGSGQRREKLLIQAGLSFYDLVAMQWSHTYYSPQDVWMLAPRLNVQDLAGAFHYFDAQTDDARLVLRVLREAVAAGGTAVNYVAAIDLIREEGQVIGVRLQDRVTGLETAVRAKIVINATGAWADDLRQKVGQEAKLRPLRGSHLIFPQWRFRLAQAVSFNHPLDNRFVFIFPWEGVTIVGTTDVDHPESLEHEPHITPGEVAYLMAAVEDRYPSLGITLDDVLATYAGVRPVINTGKADPSDESRDHVVWTENGLLTITGGKLTTFRLIALDALKAARHALPNMPKIDEGAPALDEVRQDLPDFLPEMMRRRLIGRYGQEASALVEAAQPDELKIIPNTNVLWAELRWAARSEGVVHLDDLLLRRVRLGLLLPEGGANLAEEIRSICQGELGWENGRWAEEWAAYRQRWQAKYSLPPRETIPDWHNMLQKPEPSVAVEVDKRGTAVAAGLLGTAFALILFYLGYKRRG
ncbi:Aerobic glycerol-3-phosphate dehydrogenase [hydrothermal vent metagenome]|uniref:Aerobic glycerol-3-phosphate dehydrogenase n=1 Tax=hydrothermal vent metagenome TaxID=652676 RepID=A0A3B0UM06_9ZZZZ